MNVRNQGIALVTAFALGAAACDSGDEQQTTGEIGTLEGAVLPDTTVSGGTSGTITTGEVGVGTTTGTTATGTTGSVPPHP